MFCWFKDCKKQIQTLEEQITQHIDRRHAYQKAVDILEQELESQRKGFSLERDALNNKFMMLDISYVNIQDELKRLKEKPKPSQVPMIIETTELPNKIEVPE